MSKLDRRSNYNNHQSKSNGNNQQSKNNQRYQPEIINFDNSYRKKNSEVIIKPRNPTQEKLLTMLNDLKKHIVFSIGPAGTGKTIMSVQYAIKKLKEGKVDKIIITRPAVSADEEHGFLPGDINKKMEPWVMPILDVFHEYYHPQEVKNMQDSGILEISPLAYMRGRTFKNAIVIADEVQNTTENQMKMLLTRIGENSRMFVTGDLQQADNIRRNGLLDFMTLYKDSEPDDQRMIGLVQFSEKDVERHPVIKDVLKIYNKTKKENQ